MCSNPEHIVISIHAPTRGATKCGFSNGYFVFNISIHAPTRGATESKKGVDIMGCISIHAPTRGATPEAGSLPCPCQYFNPRSHKGSDCRFYLYHLAHHISIHAPTRGATKLLSTRVHLIEISIHAPTRGATRSNSSSLLMFAISIHAPTRGATAILHKIPYLFYFIFTNPFPISYFHTQPASDF